MESLQVLWNRLDQEGMDACRIRAADEGWAIEGTAVFGDDENPVVNLSYRLLCESDWRTRGADVHGWMANDRPIDLTGGLLDVDLGFTPASNTNAIRRLDLGIGEKVETIAVWLDVADWTMKPLTQTYERLSLTVYAYESLQHGYKAELQVNTFGIVLDYPGLWKAERAIPCR